MCIYVITFMQMLALGAATNLYLQALCQVSYNKERDVIHCSTIQTMMTTARRQCKVSPSRAGNSNVIGMVGPLSRPE